MKKEEKQEKFCTMNDNNTLTFSTIQQQLTLMETLLDSIPDLLWIKDPQGVYIHCNAGFERLYNTRREQLIGKNDYDFVSKELADFFRFHDLHALQADKEVINEEYLIFNDGSYEGLFETIKKPVKDAQGNVIGILGLARDITERKRQEEHVAAQKNEFEAIFNFSKDGIAILDLESNFLDFNDAYLEMTGFTREELLSKSCIGLSVPEDVERSIHALGVVLKQGFMRNYEKSCIVKNRKRITINMSISLLSDKKRLLISTKDITITREQQHLLETQKNELEAIFTYSQDGIALVDYNSRFLDFNEAYRQITGYTREELLQKSCLELSAEEDKENARQILESVKQGNVIRNFERTCLTKNGNRVMTSVSAVLLPHTQRVLMSVKDVTAQYHITKQLEHYTTMLEDNERRLNEAQEIAHLGSWELDLVQNKLIWSDEIFRIFGINKDNFGASYEAFLDAIHPDDREMVNAAYANSLLTKKPYSITHRLLTKEGDIKYVHEKCHSYFDEKGQPFRSVGTVHDITERYLIEKRLEKLNTELENKVKAQVDELRQKDQMMIQQSKMASMGEMIGNIAHQWRQPLTALMIKKDIIIDDYLEGELTQERLDIYSQETDKILRYLSKTIDDFRHFFQPSKAIERFDVYQEIGAAINITRPSLDYRNVKLLFEQEEKPLYINGFSSEFKQVVINLINNARDAIIESKKEGIIAISITKDNSSIYVAITDNAGGIPLDIIDKIFEPYFTTKFKHQGTGLGLYMSKMIIENSMNGQLSVTNNKEGAVFMLTFPRPLKD